MALKVFVSLVLALALHNVHSARILGIIPTASYSHQMFFQQIWRELAIRGHDMVIVTTDPTGERLPNFKEISIKESYVPFRELMDIFINENLVKLLISDRMTNMSLEILEQQIMLPQVQEIIKNKTEHFDLIMIEHFLGPYYGLKHIYNCPLIGLSSFDAMSLSHDVMGNPVHSVLYPLAWLPFQEDLSFVERLSVFGFSFLLYRLQGNNNGNLLDDLVRRVYGDGIPHMMDLFEETDMLFVNANPLFSPVRPLTPSTINIAGGVHLKAPKPLPNDLQQFLDEAPNGVIYFSLGTNVKTKDVSLELRQEFLNALSELPFKVLWKFEDDVPEKSDNIRITKWAPQQDILRHPNIKLFITQGGLQSLEESLYSNVPVVVIPFLGDQAANGAKVKTKGLGVTLDRHSLKANAFKAAILEVIENPKYRMNVKALATLIQDEPMPPLEKAIWWTEYVLRHKGAQHLKGPRIPMYQFFYLDVWAFIGAVLIALLGIFFGVVKLACKGFHRLCGKKPKVVGEVKVKKS